MTYFGTACHILKVTEVDYMDNIKKILPENIRKYITKQTEEIRVKIGRPAIILNRSSEVVLPELTTKKVFQEILDSITEGSIYIFTEEINNGFITINGGHRVGLCGNAVVNDGKITAVKDISGLNIRVAREIKGVGERLFRKITENNEIESAIIVSPPGCGKTTLLRDLTRLISDNISGTRISLIDERCELAASYAGCPQTDIGIRTDVFSGYPKREGVMQAIRSMSPDIIVVDEIGADIESVKIAHFSGIKVIASMHGNDFFNIPDIFKYGIRLAKNEEFDRVEEVVCLN